MSQTTVPVGGIVFEEVAVGLALPGQTIDVSTKGVITTAIASRDFQDVHHDVEKAQERGTRTIFMNILSSNGFVLRFVTDWAGPEAVVKSSEIQLGVPNYAGDQMHMSGEVVGTEDRGDEGLVEVAVTGENSMGTHVAGTVGITLPKGHR